MTDRTMLFRSGLSLLFYLALAGGTVVAQDAPRTELGARLAENHGDGAFCRMEAVKLRQAPAYPAGTFYALKTPDAAYRTYLAGLRAVEEEAGVTSMLVNDVLGQTIPGRPEDWPLKPNCDWDVVVLKHYPNWRAWEMVEGSAAQQAAVVHRGAAVEGEQVVITEAPQVPPNAAAGHLRRPDRHGIVFAVPRPTPRGGLLPQRRVSGLDRPRSLKPLPGRRGAEYDGPRDICQRRSERRPQPSRRQLVAHAHHAIRQLARFHGDRKYP